MHLSSPQWLTGFEQPTLWLLVSTAAAGLALAVILKKYVIEWRIVISLGVLTVLLQSYHYAKQTLPTLNYHTHPVTINDHTYGPVVIVTPGSSRTKYFMQWYFRVLRPRLYRQYGKAAIEHLILRYPTPSLARAVFQQRSRLNYQQLSIAINNRKMHCSQIIVPTGDAPAPYTAQPAADHTH